MVLSSPFPIMTAYDKSSSTNMVLTMTSSLIAACEFAIFATTKMHSKIYRCFIISTTYYKSLIFNLNQVSFFKLFSALLA